MSRTEALARADRLRTSLLDHGVRAVSIEIQQGRPGTPNDRWWDDKFVAEFSHHTVSRPSNGATPVLALCKSGRLDVPGPLCNGYGGYDRVYRIICMGWANHPGSGGPVTMAGYRIPADQARPYAWGTEYEGGIEPWTDEQLEFHARSNAGILDWLGRPAEAHGEHKDPWAPGRKVDRLTITRAQGIAQIRPYLGGGATGAEDELSAADVAEIKKHIDAVLSGSARGVWTYPVGNPLPEGGTTNPAALVRVAADHSVRASEALEGGAEQVWATEVENPLDPEGENTNPMSLLRVAADHSYRASKGIGTIVGLLEEIRDRLPAPAGGEGVG